MWFGRNAGTYGSASSVTFKHKLCYHISTYHLKNNDLSPNDYFIWYGRVKRTIPGRVTLAGVTTTLTGVTDWIQRCTTGTLTNSSLGSTAAALYHQFDFKPSDIWETRRYVNWGRPKKRRLEPGHQLQIKLKCHPVHQSWKDVNPSSAAAGALPAATAATTDAGVYQDELAYKGDTIVWVMVRGAIANTASTLLGQSTTQIAHTDCINTLHAKYSWWEQADENYNDVNYTNVLPTTNPSYAANETSALYTN